MNSVVKVIYSYLGKTLCNTSFGKYFCGCDWINLTPFISGVFTAPASGIYLFATYALTVGGYNGAMFMKKNDQILCRAEVGDGENWHAASCMAVAELTPEESPVKVVDPSQSLGVVQDSPDI